MGSPPSPPILFAQKQQRSFQLHEFQRSIHLTLHYYKLRSLRNLRVRGSALLSEVHRCVRAAERQAADDHGGRIYPSPSEGRPTEGALHSGEKALFPIPSRLASKRSLSLSLSLSRSLSLSLFLSLSLSLFWLPALALSLSLPNHRFPQSRISAASEQPPEISLPPLATSSLLFFEYVPLPQNQRFPNSPTEIG